MAEILNFPGNNPNPNPNLPMRGPQGEELPENANGEPYIPLWAQNAHDQVLSEEDERALIGGASTMDRFRAMLGRQGIGVVKFGSPTNIDETVSRITDEDHDDNYKGPRGDYTPTYYDTMFRRIPGGPEGEEESIADGERRFRVQDASRRRVSFAEGRQPWEVLSDNVQEIMDARSQKTGIRHIGIEGARHLPGVPTLLDKAIDKDNDTYVYVPRRDERISQALKGSARALGAEVMEGQDEYIDMATRPARAASRVGRSAVNRVITTPASVREAMRHAPAKAGLAAAYYQVLAKETFESYWQKAKNLRNRS